MKSILTTLAVLGLSVSAFAGCGKTEETKGKLKSVDADSKSIVIEAEGKEVKRFDDSLLEDGEEEAFTYKADINPFVKSLVDQLSQAGK